MNSTLDNASRAFLIVEDELMILGIVKSVLSGFGREVLTAPSIQRARDLLCQNARRIELLITDVTLADGSGLEFASMASQSYPSLKIVLMTGFAPRDTLPSSFHYELLEKPFDIESLKRAVTTSLA